MQIAEMILAVPEKDLEKTLTSVMQDLMPSQLSVMWRLLYTCGQDLSAPARAKILQAIEKVEALGCSYLFPSVSICFHYLSV